MAEWRLDKNVEKMISEKDASLLTSYRFVLYVYKDGEPIPIGLVQDVQIQEGRMNQPVGEIGSLLAKNIPGPFQGFLAINKILVFQESLISATHDLGPNGSNLELDLLQTFGRHSDFLLVAFDPDQPDELNTDSGVGANIIGRARINKAKIQNKSLSAIAGQPQVIESATFQFVDIEDI